MRTLVRCPSSEDGITSPSSVNPTSAPASENHTDDQPITESTSGTTAEISTGNHSSEKLLLQSREDRNSRSLSRNGGIEIAEPPKPSVGGLELNRLYFLLNDPDSAAHRAATKVIGRAASPYRI